MYDKKFISLLSVVGLCSGILSELSFRFFSSYLPGVIFGLFIGWVFLKERLLEGDRLGKLILFMAASTFAWIVAFYTTMIIGAQSTAPGMAGMEYPAYAIGGAVGGFLFLRFFSAIIQKISYKHILFGTLLSSGIALLSILILRLIPIFVIWQTGMAIMIGACTKIEISEPKQQKG